MTHRWQGLNCVWTVLEYKKIQINRYLPFARPGLTAEYPDTRTNFFVYCISCRRCNCLYIGETGRRLRERFSEHLRSIRNQSRGFPVAEHFTSASHSLDDIMVCGLKQCSGSNISRKQHEMKLIFKLGTLRPNGLNINFNFLWLWLYRALPLRAQKQWFSNLFTLYFMRALSVRAYAYNFLHGVVTSTYWWRAKPETSSSPEQILHFWKHFCLLPNFFVAGYAVRRNLVIEVEVCNLL